MIQRFFGRRGTPFVAVSIAVLFGILSGHARVSSDEPQKVSQSWREVQSAIDSGAYHPAVASALSKLHSNGAAIVPFGESESGPLFYIRIDGNVSACGSSNCEPWIKLGESEWKGDADDLAHVGLFGSGTSLHFEKFLVDDDLLGIVGGAAITKLRFPLYAGSPSELTAGGFAEIAKMPLESLAIIGNGVSLPSGAIQHLGNLSDLEELELQGLKLTASDLGQLVRLEKLRR